jgi:UDP-N-acetylglucosamine--N-acetylmuramyl-(pentapeptide) pyrophosphoryl-undecaprenol N-acetylglucosamine transferase
MDYCYTLIMTKSIIITGTHLTPALELIRQLQQDQKIKWQISYIGRESNSNNPNDTSIESKTIPLLGIKFYPISCGKLDRRFLPNTLTGIPKTIKGFIQSYKIINQVKPDIIVSFGGYVSVPTVIISFLKGIKSITHEQTLTNSLTTKINSYFVNKIALSFDNQKQIQKLPKNKVVVTGNLLRYQLFQKQLTIPKGLRLKANRLLTIYITAGNQGSHIINLNIKKIIPKLGNYKIIHQTGKNDLKTFTKISQKYPNYFASDYFDTQSFAWIINHSDLIISRSGANTSQEIVAFNKKSILIPLLKSQQNEQILNAAWVKKQLPKSTIIINNDELNSQLLIDSIKKLSQVKTKPKFSFVKPNLKLLNLIHEIV